MELSPQQKVSYTISIGSIVVPILVMFWDIGVGTFLLLLGLMIAYRAIRFAGHNDMDSVNAATRQQLDRHQSERGRTILVQVVDNFGRELPPASVGKLMAEAQAKAGPRDTVVAVRHKIAKE